MIKAVLTNEILKYITEIDKNRYKVSSVKLPGANANRLRKNSKKKSSYASNKIEGNPLSFSGVTICITGNPQFGQMPPSIGVPHRGQSILKPPFYSFSFRDVI